MHSIILSMDPLHTIEGLGMRKATKYSPYQHVDEENGNEDDKSSPQQVGDGRERNIG